jgi:hypothetical protein
MVTVVAAPTETLVTVKVAVVAPTGTVTLAGVVDDALLSDKVTTAPAPTAGLSRVTVPVEDVPPVTVAGLIATLTSAGGLIVKVAVRVTPLYTAVIVTVLTALTGMVVTVNVAVVEPAGTVTLAGVVALALLSESVTTAPPAGAKPVKVTVPVEDVPPVTAVGLMATEVSAAGLTVKVAVRVPL